MLTELAAVSSGCQFVFVVACTVAILAMMVTGDV